MRKRYSLFAAMALSGLALIGLTVSAGRTTANFTASANTTASFTTELVQINLVANGAGTVLASVTSLVPGDITAAKTVVVTNPGTTSYTYTVTPNAPTTPTVLWSDATNGLQVQIKRGVTQIYPVTAGAYGAVNAVAGATFGTSTLAGGASDTYSFTFQLPTTAGNANSATFMGKTESFSYTFTATGANATTGVK